MKIVARAQSCVGGQFHPEKTGHFDRNIQAKDLNITRQNLSQAINDEIGKNFYQLINEFRVTEFKKYLNDPKMNHITFLGLAYEAGFNSKSSFYRVFKEITGETPTEFRQRIKRDDPQAP